MDASAENPPDEGNLEIEINNVKMVQQNSSD